MPFVPLLPDSHGELVYLFLLRRDKVFRLIKGLELGKDRTRLLGGCIKPLDPVLKTLLFRT